MLSEALYYPHMRVDNSTWLRSQLLYFDRISTISPWHVRDVPPNVDEAQLESEGFLVRRPPNLMKAAVERASRFMAMLLIMSRNRGLGSHFIANPIYAEASRSALQMLRELGNPDRGRSVRRLAPHVEELAGELQASLSDRYVRVHPEKLHWVLRNFLENGRAPEENPVDTDRWVEVDPLFASIYMTVLAREMSSQMGASGITDEPVHDALYQDVMSTNRISQTPMQTVRRAEGIVVDVIFKSVNISPDTPISKILKFRKRHGDELSRFRSVIGEMANRCATMVTLGDIRREAELILRRDINQSIDELERALSGAGIVWSRSGIMKATSLVFNMAAGLATFDFTGSHYWALSASLGLGLMAVGLSEGGDREAALEAARCSYLLNLRRELGEVPVSRH